MSIVIEKNPYYERNKIERETRLEEARARSKRRNLLIIIILVIMVFISFINMFSASFYKLYFQSTKVVTRHFFYLFIGSVAFIISSKINYKRFNNYKLNSLMILLSYLLLAVVIVGAQIPQLKRVFPVINGAIGWIRIFGFSLQPSELLKISFIIINSNLFQLCEERRENIPQKILFISIVNGIFFLLIILQHDLGTAIHYMSILVFMIFMTKIHTKLILLGTFSASIFGSLLGYLILFTNFFNEGYKVRRIKSFVDGLLYGVYDNAVGYQVGQSLLAFGSGGVFGKGFGNGIQKYSYLPEIKTDFILSSFGEEFGFLGMITLLILLLLLFNTIKRTAMETQDYFGKYLTIGIAGYIISQSLINMSVALGILPVFGIPMPLFSFGGTSIMTVLFSLGIVININRTGFKKL